MYALLSVFQKDGIESFAKSLVDLGWELLASGRTARTIAAAGIPVRDVAELIGGKAILGHRVVTLSREVYAGILARKTEEDVAELAALGIQRIGLVCVDCYPLEAEIRKPEATRDSVIEMTDIGGPTLLRAAAKAGAIVICDPADRALALRLAADHSKLLIGDAADANQYARDSLAAKAEAYVARYALVSARFRGAGGFDGVVGRRVHRCRYGENPWQQPASLYVTDDEDPLSLGRFTNLRGQELSYTAYCDLDRALQTLTHIQNGAAALIPERYLAAVGVKHGNACGAGVSSEDPALALEKMLCGDERALFGGTIMVNFPIDGKLADCMAYRSADGARSRRFLSMVVAPSFNDEAIDILRGKTGRTALLANEALGDSELLTLDSAPRLRSIRGGFLLQGNYTNVFSVDRPDMEVHGERDTFDWFDLSLAWAVGATSNSNTITIVKGWTLLGNGVGQQDRVGCCELAVKRARDAGHSLNGAVAYSDSFFPFPDGPEVLAKAGITAILASSGSKNDPQVVEACERLGVTLVLVPDEAARGFYGH